MGFQEDMQETIASLDKIAENLAISNALKMVEICKQYGYSPMEVKEHVDLMLRVMPDMTMPNIFLRLKRRLNEP